MDISERKMDRKLFDVFREKVNEHDLVFQMYHDRNGKDQWSIICSAMDWIEVVIDEIDEKKLSRENDNASSVKIMTFINCIDVLWEAIQQLHTLQIGDISDIAEIVSAKDIFDTPQNIYNGYKLVDRVDPMIWPDELKRIGMPAPYQWSATSYCGWGDRPSFQNKVIEIDGGKQRLAFSI